MIRGSARAGGIAVRIQDPRSVVGDDVETPEHGDLVTGRDVLRGVVSAHAPGVDADRVLADAEHEGVAASALDGAFDATVLVTRGRTRAGAESKRGDEGECGCRSRTPSMSRHESNLRRSSRVDIPYIWG